MHKCEHETKKLVVKRNGTAEQLRMLGAGVEKIIDDVIRPCEKATSKVLITSFTDDSLKAHIL